MFFFIFFILKKFLLCFYFICRYNSDDGNKSRRHHCQKLELLVVWLSTPIRKEKQGCRVPLVNLIVSGVVVVIAWEKKKVGRGTPCHVCLIC